MERTIFHVDMDAFYAAVEQRDHPEYRNRAVIIGADPRAGAGRGVVAACSYQARSFGIHSAMPIGRAYRLCPGGIYLRPDMKKYQSVSRSIRAVLESFTEIIEPVSIDEAFLDLSKQVADRGSALLMGRLIKQKIREAEQLSCSVGIAPNKFVAKIASDLKKPDGLVLVMPGEVQGFLDPLPISRLWGVGPRTESRLLALEIKNILQLRHHDRGLIRDKLGKLGEHLWLLANGVDDRPVSSRGAPKSLGHETTFQDDESNPAVLEQALRRLSGKVARRLQKRGLRGRTVTLKLRYSNFRTLTRRLSKGAGFNEERRIYGEAQRLLREFRDPARKVRLIGVSVSGLEADGREDPQLRLF